jgi:pilus assembly protein CpaD
MTRITTLLRTCATGATLAAALTLGGCAVDELEAEHVYVPNSGSEQFPIVVERGPSTLSLANTGSLTPGQINAVGHVARIAASSKAPVIVSRPAGASPRLAHEVANLLAQQGVPPQRIKLASHRGSSNGPLKLTVNKLHARTSPCGEWPEDLTHTRMNEPYYNFGCAVQSNVAAMVVDPEDFVTPTPTTPATAASRVLNIEAIDGSGKAKDPVGAAGGTGGGTSTKASAP